MNESDDTPLAPEPPEAGSGLQPRRLAEAGAAPAPVRSERVEASAPDEGADGAAASATTPEARPSPSMPARAARRIPADALSARNELARAKGLPGVMIEGGTDPDPEATRERERPYVRLLLVMIAVIVLAGFVLGFVGMVIGGPAPS